jgi:hypothetical protein
MNSLVFKISLAKQARSLLFGFLGLGVSAALYFGLINTNYFGQMIFLLWILLVLLVVVSLALIAVFFAQFFTMRTNAIVVNSTHLILSDFSIPEIQLPWIGIEKIGLYGTGKQKSLVITMDSPANYLPELSSYKKMTINARSSNYGTPFVLSLSLLQEEPELIYEKINACWAEYDLTRSTDSSDVSAD